VSPLVSGARSATQPPLAAHILNPSGFAGGSVSSHVDAREVS
jgi:hypothetical protein